MNEKLLNITEWVAKLAYLNLLWLLTTALGIIVFGLFPASVAMMATLRRTILDGIHTPVLKTYVQALKATFTYSFLYGLIFNAIVVIIYFNLIMIETYHPFNTLLFQVPVFTFVVFSILSSLFFIPVYLHYNLPFFKVFKHAFLIMMIHPKQTLMLVISIALTFYLMQFLPALYFFFGGSFIGLLIHSITIPIFRKLTADVFIDKAHMV